jgi:hypothetical protein
MKNAYQRLHLDDAHELRAGEHSENCPPTSRLYELVTHVCRGTAVPDDLREHYKHVLGCTDCQSIFETAKWSLWRQILNDSLLSEAEDTDLEPVPSSDLKENDEGTFPVVAPDVKHPPYAKLSNCLASHLFYIDVGQPNSKAVTVNYNEGETEAGRCHLVGSTSEDSNNHFLRQSGDVLIYLVDRPDELSANVVFRILSSPVFERIRNNWPPVRNDKSFSLMLDKRHEVAVPWLEDATAHDDMVLEIQIPRTNVTGSASGEACIEGYSIRVIRFPASEWRSLNVKRFAIERR